MKLMKEVLPHLFVTIVLYMGYGENIMRRAMDMGMDIG